MCGSRDILTVLACVWVKRFSFSKTLLQAQGSRLPSSFEWNECCVMSQSLFITESSYLPNFANVLIESEFWCFLIEQNKKSKKTTHHKVKIRLLNIFYNRLEFEDFCPIKLLTLSALLPAAGFDHVLHSHKWL